MKTSNFDVVIVGGGAAGYFTAINLAEARPELRIVILEKSKDVLQKVRISGGGRCNVTHAEFDPRSLADYYPRGKKELLGPFHKFMTGDTVEWFEQRGIALKTEADGRMFPVSDSSQTIVDCLMGAAQKAKVELRTGQAVVDFEKTEHGFGIKTVDQTYAAKNLVICAGSSKIMWSLLKSKGHSIIPPVPSLFTFNIKEESLTSLQGISQQAVVHLIDEKGRSWLNQSGSVLVTHWGLSGPGILKLSAVAARQLHALGYSFEIKINWLPELAEDEVMDTLKATRNTQQRQLVSSSSPFGVPKRMWKYFCNRSGIVTAVSWAELTKKQMQRLKEVLLADKYRVYGKSTFKEEFVTAGGVELSEIDFKSFESKKLGGLFMAGEVINIDALTGGFNFQNAWTGGYIIASAISQKS